MINETIKQSYIENRLREIKSNSIPVNFTFYEIKDINDISKQDNILLEKVITDKCITWFEYSTLQSNSTSIKNPYNRRVLYFIKDNSMDLQNIMGVDESSKLWNLSAGYIKNLCSQNKIISTKIGKTWVILKTQANPSKHLK